MTTVALARPRAGTSTLALALAVVPAALLAGALWFQYARGLAPCEMCLWQRWPLGAAILAAAAALARPAARRPLLILAAGAIATSGAIGAFHAGVEYGFWPGPTQCTALATGGGDFLANLVAARLVRCDAPAWTLAGVSLAGLNALVSLGTGFAGLAGLARTR